MAKQQWLINFKEFLTRNSMDDRVPEKVVVYLDGIFVYLINKSKSEREKILVLEEEKKRLLKTLNDYSQERAEAVLKLEQLQYGNEMEVGSAISSRM